MTGAIADRRAELRRLIHNYGSLLDELADKDKELVDAGRRVERGVRVVRRRGARTSRDAVARLPGDAAARPSDTLDEGRRRSRRCCARRSSRCARPFRQLDDDQPRGPAVRPRGRADRAQRRSARSCAPRARTCATCARPRTNLAEATPDLTASFHQLNRFFNMGAFNPNGREPVTGNEAAGPRARRGLPVLARLGRAEHRLAVLDERRDRPVPPRARRLQLHRHRARRCRRSPPPARSSA